MTDETTSPPTDPEPAPAEPTVPDVAGTVGEMGDAVVEAVEGVGEVLGSLTGANPGGGEATPDPEEGDA